MSSLSRVAVVVSFAGFLAGGCAALRLAPNETQKRNAWLHNRTAMAAARTAKAEGASAQLQDLTELSELQSRAFTAYFGPPKQSPPAETPQQILAEYSWHLAERAVADSAARPRPWDLADSILDLGIGVFGLLGGVYGLRAVQFLKQARAKSKALREIIAGNEVFKRANAEQARAFKQAHANQSPQTRRIVTEMKSA